MIKPFQTKYLYDKIYSNPSFYINYGHTNHGSKWISHLLNNNITSWLDVGCGHNELVSSIRKKYKKIDSWGIDFSCPSADQICDILDLPFPDKRWDYITAFDVMEHLLPNEVSHALYEMSRVSHRFAFTISFREAYTVVDNVNVHTCIWSKSKWKEEIIKAGGIISKNIDDFFQGEWTIEEG